MSALRDAFMGPVGTVPICGGTFDNSSKPPKLKMAFKYYHIERSSFISINYLVIFYLRMCVGGSCSCFQSITIEPVALVIFCLIYKRVHWEGTGPVSTPNYFIQFTYML